MTKEYYVNPISVTSQFYFCPIPLRLDTYSGCTNNCIYCFANNSKQKIMNNKDIQEIKERCGIFNNSIVKPTKLEYVKKYFDIAFEGKKNTFKNQEALAIDLLKRKVPIHFGGMSDGFQPVEKYFKISLEVLKLLKKYNYPLIISTKCKLIIEDEYYEILKDYDNVGIQVSLIDNRQEVANIIEPGLGKNSVKDRFDILDKYKDKWTAVRIQPFIIYLTEDIINEYLEELKKHNINHIVIEGLKFVNSNNDMNYKISNAFKIITGKSFNLLKYYKSIGAKVSGNDVELPSWRKEQYLNKIKKKCNELGITFGAADNDLRLMGDNPCCCGNKDMPGMDNVCKYNIGFATFRAYEKYKKNNDYNITLSEIEKEIKLNGTIRLIMNKEKLKLKLGENNYKDACISIDKLFMEQWNNCGKNSPCQHFFVKKSNNFDKNGNLIYKFKTSEELEEERLMNKQKTLF